MSTSTVMILYALGKTRKFPLLKDPGPTENRANTAPAWLCFVDVDFTTMVRKDPGALYYKICSFCHFFLLITCDFNYVQSITKAASILTRKFITSRNQIFDDTRHEYRIAQRGISPDTWPTVMRMMKKVIVSVPPKTHHPFDFPLDESDLQWGCFYRHLL